MAQYGQSLGMSKKPTSYLDVIKQKEQEKKKFNLFDFSDVAQKPQLNFGPGMSGPGITNFQDFKANIPQQPTQPTQQSGFSIIPTTNADFIGELEYDIKNGATSDEIIKAYPEIKGNTQLVDELIYDIQNGATIDEVKQAYPELSGQDIQQNVKPTQPKENIPGLDVGVKASQGISEFGKGLKFEAGNDLIKSKNPFVSSFGNMLEGFKFAGNIPGDTLQLAGDLGQAISNPIGTAKSVKTLAEATIETGLNKVFGTDIYTSEDKKQMIDGVSKALKENFGSMDAIQKTIIENPTDVLLTIQGGLQTAKLGIKNPNTIAKLDQVSEAINPINILKTEGKIAGKVAEKTIGQIPTAIKKSGEALYKTAIKPNVNEAELLLKSKAGLGKIPITRADTALKLGLTGTETQIGVKSLKEADKIFKQTIGPALDKSKITHNLDDIFKKVETTIKSGKEGELRTKELLEGLEALKDDYSTLSKTFTTKALQAEKTSLDKFTPTKIFKGKEVADAYNQVKNTFANVIREQVRDDLGTLGIKNAKELYRDYANLTELSKIGIKGLTEGGLKGGFGTFWSTLYDKLATPIKTVGGKVLYRTGEGLEFIGPKGIKKVGDYLKLNKIDVKDGNVINLSSKLGENANNNLMNTNILRNNSITGMDRNIIKPSILSPREKKLLKPNQPTNVSNKTIIKPKKTGRKVLKPSIDEYKETIGNWKPTNGGYKVENIDVSKTNAFPRAKYHREDYVNTAGYKYWKEQIAKGKEITPVVVEKTDKGFYVLDGYHRLAAAEDSGVKNIKAIILDNPVKKGEQAKGIKQFTTFTDKEIQDIVNTQSNKSILKKLLPSNFKEKAENLVDKIAEKTGAKTNLLPTNSKQVSKVSDELISEARKYKSAEEFIKSQAVKEQLKIDGTKINKDGTVTLYHTTTKENAKKINEMGEFIGKNSPVGGMIQLENPKPMSFFGTDKEWTKKTWGGPNNELIEIKVPAEYIRKGAGNKLEVYFEGGLKKKGNIWIPTQEVRSTFYDRVAELDLVDKSQLKQIYEQANKPKKIKAK